MGYDFDTPEWVHHAVFYQVFPDRFASSSRVVKPSNLEAWDTPPTAYGFKGGDLLGIVEHLDYLQDLGINAIYLNPIFQSASNHRYHTHDYYQVDPLLGGIPLSKSCLPQHTAAESVSSWMASSIMPAEDFISSITSWKLVRPHPMLIGSTFLASL